MIDWLNDNSGAVQAFAVCALAVVTAVYAYFTWRMVREMREQRLAQREAEERQAIRQFRRDRVQPVLDFLNMAKQFAAREPITTTVDEVYENLRSEDKPPLEEWNKVRRVLFPADLLPVQEVAQLGQGCLAADMAGIPMPGLREELAKIFVSLAVKGQPERSRQLSTALRSAEQLIEQYLAGAEPQAAGIREGGRSGRQAT